MITPFFDKQFARRRALARPHCKAKLWLYSPLYRSDTALVDTSNHGVSAKLGLMTDCQHSWMQRGRKLALDTILDDWLGPTLALVKCEECAAPALLHLVSWRGNGLAERIYAIRLVAPKTRNTYLANINRDYCDLTRKTSETEAFIGACSQSARLVLVTSLDMIVEASSTALLNPPVMDWQEVKTETYDDWMKFLIR